MTDRYVFPIVDALVVDGDTYRLTLDPGFRLTTIQPVRLDGWDCPEKHPRADQRPGIENLDHEIKEATRAHHAANDWLHEITGNHPLWCRTRKDPDSFGRWLGTIWATDGADQPYYLHEYLERLHLATPWPTRWWTVWGKCYSHAMQMGAQNMREALS